MPDQTDRLTPEQLTAIRHRSNRFEKALTGASEEAAIRAGFTSAVDVVPLLAEVEALREQVAELRTASMHRLIGMVPSGELRNRLAKWVADEQRRVDAEERMTP